eukprot:UN33632
MDYFLSEHSRNEVAWCSSVVNCLEPVNKRLSTALRNKVYKEGETGETDGSDITNATKSFAAAEEHVWKTEKHKTFC